MCVCFWSCDISCTPQDRWKTVEELNKELRQCKLQQFILQSGSGPHGEQTTPQPSSDLYLSNAGIVEPPGPCGSSRARTHTLLHHC